MSVTASCPLSIYVSLSFCLVSFLTFRDIRFVLSFSVRIDVCFFILHWLQVENSQNRFNSAALLCLAKSGACGHF